MSTFPQNRMELGYLRYEDILIEANRARVAADVSRGFLVNDVKRDIGPSFLFARTHCWLRRVAVRFALLASKASGRRQLANV
jgi:hypothetical protein